VALSAQTAKVDVSTPTGQAFARMYDSDFAGAHAILDRAIRQEPDVPLYHSVKGLACLFSELDRLKILQFDFFANDEKIIDRRKLTPDAAVRVEIFRRIARARQLANARLAAHANDRDALFAHCIASGLVTDYAALIEKRRLASFSLAKDTQVWSNKLLALDPPFYDAHLAVGSVEYVLGSLPFFIRWFIHIDNIEGSKQKAMRDLQLVAQHGRYYGPFARVLLSVIHLREKRPWEAEKLLTGLAEEYPENQLFREELARIRRARRR
jgi:hypothetical protein